MKEEKNSGPFQLLDLLTTSQHLAEMNSPVIHSEKLSLTSNY